MRWSWNHGADEVWRQLDPDLWDLTHNPWGVLQTVSRDRIERVLGDPGVRRRIDELLQARRQTADWPTWFHRTHSASPPLSVAYFQQRQVHAERSASDLLGRTGQRGRRSTQAASHLGVPVVAVGLLYQQGYFRQVIDSHGAQQALFPYNDPGQLPMAGRRPEASGSGWRSRCRAIPCGCGPGRSRSGGRGSTCSTATTRQCAAHRGITGELYGGGPELRLMQETGPRIGGLAAAGSSGPPAGGLPSERRPCGLRRPGAGPGLHDGDGRAIRGRSDRDPRRQSVHHAHRCARRVRPLSPGAHRAVSRPLRPHGELGITLEESTGPGASEDPADAGRRASTWRIWPSAAAAPSTA